MKFIAVPQYENLTIDTILEYGLSHRSVVDTLPAVREIKKMPRGYICNVIYTLVGDDFGAWVKGRCKERNDRLARDHNSAIQLDSRIAAAFEASGFVSHANGTGGHL